ncbi:alpha/beta family hydrolase [Streptomyces sp. NBC_00091]|uniref:phosphoribosyltransferase family protein n=1 Tax=Streptomyces sp. NBC_00091 TaxID=2975648 RepID=UPI0022577B27|nr:alpha/beta family hydrolase [Streptomyces sp. NBC_00091]MCX5375863.1 phosphoribosyltransferase family protein [Streptomyces sp. NBC_00091]
MLFTDRDDAGVRLAVPLRKYSGQDPVVLGLPRGGVPVAFQVALALGAPLDVVVVRKLGVPYHRELGFGAIGEGGVRVISEDVVRSARVREEDLRAVEDAERAELVRQARRFRGDRPRLELRGRTAIVVDDGIATGATAAAACEVVRSQGAARVVMAAPVAPPDAVARVGAVADEVVCLSTPRAFSAVGEWYQDFSQTPDEEVVSLLAQAAARPAPTAGEQAGEQAGYEAGDEAVEVHAAGLRLAGSLTLPPGAGAVVVFAHGSGSSRHSPRNRSVASVLNRAGLGTLLFDLLTADEEATRANVFDIATLSGRLTRATAWLRGRTSLPVGYFGASTGAAAALEAAASPDADIGAVVSRGGRPDLAGRHLGAVRAPTLLIVGGDDTLVLDLNRQAQRELRCENRLEVIEGATHLFEEPGALDEAAALARDWFTRHLTARPGTP